MSNADHIRSALSQPGTSAVSTGVTINSARERNLLKKPSPRVGIPTSRSSIEGNDRKSRPMPVDFTLLSRSGSIAIDGSKFKAVNNRDRNLTVHKLRSRMEHMEHSVARYLDELDRADRISIPLAPDRVTHLQQKIATIRAHMKQLASWGEQLASAPDQQISMTDPDSRSMVTKDRGTGMVGYNVQTAVESQHHLIVAHEVTNDCSDRSHLVSMANLARDATGQANPTVLADRGYYKGEEIVECER